LIVHERTDPKRFHVDDYQIASRIRLNLGEDKTPSIREPVLGTLDSIATRERRAKA